MCEGGFYGLSCSESCGHCKTGTFCNNIIGVCPNGCQNHWNGFKCDSKTIKYMPFQLHNYICISSSEGEILHWIVNWYSCVSVYSVEYFSSDFWGQF